MFTILPRLLRPTMYNDGLWYAAIARNMAEGDGNFFLPQLSQTIGNTFYSHPPLQFFIQSWFFSSLGDSFYTERIYCLLVFLLVGYLIVLLWKVSFMQDETSKSSWYIPLIFWLLNEVTFNFYPANILEVTLSLFGVLSILLMHYSFRVDNRNKYLLLVGSSFCISLAIFTKGLMGLFPIAYPFLYWLVMRDCSFLKVIQRTILICVIPLICIVAFYSIPDGKTYVQNYFSNQVSNSLAGKAQHHFRENRLYIIRRLLEVCLPMIIITIGILGYEWKTKKYLKWNKNGILFLLIGVSASFPIVFSPKQSFYYLLPSIPFFALGMGILVGSTSNIRKFIMNSKNRKFNILLYSSIFILFMGVLYNILTATDLKGRDRRLVEDIRVITSTVPNNEIIGSTTYSASLVGYLARNYNISIDTNRVSFDKYNFLITSKNDKNNIPQSFVKTDFESDIIDLYTKK